MFLILVLGGVVVQIPMPVLAGIMIMVAIGTFDWHSYSYLRKAPKSDALVMLVTVFVVVATDNLAMGVIVGVILSAVFFAAKISKVSVKQLSTERNVRFDVTGQLFFVSVEGFVEAFDFNIADSDIIIDFSNAHIWDDSGVGAVDKVVIKYRENHNRVTIKGLNTSSEKLINKLAVYQDPNAQLKSH